MATEPDGTGRINVSEDRLNGALAKFELSLRDFIEKKLDAKADLYLVLDIRTQLDAVKSTLIQRDKEVEEAQRERDKEVDGRLGSLEKWRYGVAVLVSAVVLLAGFVLKYVL